MAISKAEEMQDIKDAIMLLFGLRLIVSNPKAVVILTHARKFLQNRHRELETA